MCKIKHLKCNHHTVFYLPTDALYISLRKH